MEECAGVGEKMQKEGGIEGGEGINRGRIGERKPGGGIRRV